MHTGEQAFAISFRNQRSDGLPEGIDVARKLLRESEFSRDQLPYTPEFERLKKKFTKLSRRSVEDSEFWQILTRAGKRGGLAREKRKKKRVPSPRLTTGQQLELMRLLPDGIGSRDQLPYTQLFDDLHCQFCKLTRTRLDGREFWRVLSRVAKRSRKPKPVFQTAPLGGLDPRLVEMMEFQNPWWIGKPGKLTPLFCRCAFAEVVTRLSLDLTPIVAIRGPRQVGKTTIQEQLIEQLLKLDHVPPSHIFRMEFDDASSLGSFTQPVITLVRWFEENVLKDSLNAFANRKEPVYLFFDEVQYLKDWASQLKTLVDHRKAAIVVTGSSALRIGDGRGSLVGRASMLELGPFRLNEIAGVRKLGELPPFQPNTSVADWTGKEFWLDLARYSQEHKAVLRKAFDLFSDVGGYPVCHKPGAKRSDLGAQIADDVVKRTVNMDLRAGQGGKRQRREIIEETYRQVCRYAGQEITGKRIREDIEKVLGQGVPQNAVHNAIRFLADALLVHEVFPMEALSKRQSHSPKLCLCDHYVREAWLQEKLPVSISALATAGEEVCTAAGHLIESDIGYYLKGIPGLNVSWFPIRGEEPEVDFVLTIGLRRIPMEVKYRRGAARHDHLRGLQSFCGQAKYNAPFGLLITQDTSGVVADNIIALPAYALLSVR